MKEIYFEKLPKINDVDDFKYIVEHNKEKYNCIIKITGQRRAIEKGNENCIKVGKEKFHEHILEGKVTILDTVEYYFLTQGFIVRTSKKIIDSQINLVVTSFSTGRYHIEIPKNLQAVIKEGDEISLQLV